MDKLMGEIIKGLSGEKQLEFGLEMIHDGLGDSIERHLPDFDKKYRKIISARLARRSEDSKN